jgi:hypothetical protein
MNSNHKRLKIGISPSVLEDGTIGRVVRLPDGSARNEMWFGEKWVPNQLRWTEFFKSRKLSDEELAAFNFPDDADPPDNPER